MGEMEHLIQDSMGTCLCRPVAEELGKLKLLIPPNLL